MVAFNKNKVIEYLLYLLSFSFFIGKSFKVVAALIVILFLVDVAQKSRWYVFKDPLFIILALWCSYLFCSAIWAVEYISSMKGSLELFLWCLLYVAIKYTLMTKSLIENFIYAQAIVILFVVLSALIQFSFGFNFFGIPIEASRVTDPMSNTRLFGYVFPIWIGFFGSILALKGQEKKKYILYSLVLIGMLLALPLTGSRGPLIILAIFLPLIAWMSPFRKWAFFALGCVIVSSAFLVATTPVLQERLKTLSNPFENQKHTRVAIWLTALEEFKDNPIVGVGFKNFRYRQFEYYKESFESHEINPATGSMAMHAHSPWMDILAEQGIVGVLFAFALLFVIAKQAYQRGAITIIGSMGVWYAFSILNSGFSLSNGRWSFFMILAISFFAISVNYQKEKQEDT